MWNSPLRIHLSGEETPENQGSGHELSALALHSRKSAKQYLGSPPSCLFLPVTPFPPSLIGPTTAARNDTPLHPFLVFQKNEAFALVWNHLEDEKLETERLRGRTIVLVLGVFQHLFQKYAGHSAMTKYQVTICPLHPCLLNEKGMHPRRHSRRCQRREPSVQASLPPAPLCVPQTSLSVYKADL